MSLDLVQVLCSFVNPITGMVLFYFVVFYCDYVIFRKINMGHLPKFLRIASLALGQSYDCPSASHATLKNMGKSVTQSKTYDIFRIKRSKVIHKKIKQDKWDTLWFVIVVFSILENYFAQTSFTNLTYFCHWKQITLPYILYIYITKCQDYTHWKSE